MCDQGSTIIHHDGLDEDNTTTQDIKTQSYMIPTTSGKSFLSRLALCFAVSVIGMLGCIYIYETVESINEPVRSLNKDYKWPCLSDFVQVLWELPLTIVINLNKI